MFAEEIIIASPVIRWISPPTLLDLLKPSGTVMKLSIFADE
jgi:hypothetical protein